MNPTRQHKPYSSGVAPQRRIKGVRRGRIKSSSSPPHSPARGAYPIAQPGNGGKPPGPVPSRRQGVGHLSSLGAPGPGRGRTAGGAGPAGQGDRRDPQGEAGWGTSRADRGVKLAHVFFPLGAGADAASPGSARPPLVSRAAPASGSSAGHAESALRGEPRRLHPSDPLGEQPDELAQVDLTLADAA